MPNIHHPVAARSTARMTSVEPLRAEAGEPAQDRGVDLIGDPAGPLRHRRDDQPRRPGPPSPRASPCRSSRDAAAGAGVRPRGGVDGRRPPADGGTYVPVGAGVGRSERRSPGGSPRSRRPHSIATTRRPPSRGVAAPRLAARGGVQLAYGVSRRVRRHSVDRRQRRRLPSGRRPRGGSAGSRSPPAADRGRRPARRTPRRSIAGSVVNRRATSISPFRSAWRVTGPPGSSAEHVIERHAVHVAQADEAQAARRALGAAPRR